MVHDYNYNKYIVNYAFKSCVDLDVHVANVAYIHVQVIFAWMIVTVTVTVAVAVAVALAVAVAVAVVVSVAVTVTVTVTVTVINFVAGLYSGIVTSLTLLWLNSNFR